MFGTAFPLTLPSPARPHPRPTMYNAFVVRLPLWPGPFEEVRGWGLINGLVLEDESQVLAGAVVSETTKLGLLLVPAGLKVKLSKRFTLCRHSRRSWRYENSLHTLILSLLAFMRCLRFS